jgi:hypothetical protein
VLSSRIFCNDTNFCVLCCCIWWYMFPSCSQKGTLPEQLWRPGLSVLTSLCPTSLGPGGFTPRGKIFPGHMRPVVMA